MRNSIQLCVRASMTGFDGIYLVKISAYRTHYINILYTA